MGTSNACPSMPMIDRVQATPSSAVMIGTIIATALPNANSKDDDRRADPDDLAEWVDGFETFLPR